MTTSVVLDNSFLILGSDGPELPQVLHASYFAIATCGFLVHPGLCITT